jgi:hypothetical protein
MKVEFNASMYTNFSLGKINSSWVDIYIEPYENPREEPRQVNGTTQFNLTWEVKSFEKQQLFIQINFTSPESISPYMEQDTLVMHIRNESIMFYSPEQRNFLYPGAMTMKKKVTR